MVYQTHALSGALTTSSDTGTSVDVDSLIDKWVLVAGMSVGSLDIEISFDGGTTFVVPNSDLTGIAADGCFELPQACTHVRIEPTGATLASVTLRARTA